MTGTIYITIDPESLVGSDGCDKDASLARFEKLVVEDTRQAYPEAAVEVTYEQMVRGTQVIATGTDDDDSAQDNIPLRVEAVWSRFNWMA